MTPLCVDLEPEWRGGQNQALLTLRGLRARGHPAELLALRERPLAHRAQAEGIPVHGVGRRAARLQAALLLRQLLARRHFDLVHANEPDALTATWLAGAHRRVPVVVSRRVGFPLQSNPIARARYHAAQRIIAVSRFVADRVIASGIAAERVDIIHDGTEVPPLPSAQARRQARQRWNIGENEKLLGCVGYLVAQKQHDILVRALAMLSKQFPECRLLVAGDGPGRESLKQLTRELGVDSAVQFAGFVEDVGQVYAALDVFAFPSREEGLGSALLGAMACGLPVVATASGGVPEIVDERNGLLVAGFRAEGFAAALVRLLSDADLAKRLGMAGRESILQRFTADAMVAKTLRLYDKLILGGSHA